MAAWPAGRTVSTAASFLWEKKMLVYTMAIKNIRQWKKWNQPHWPKSQKIRDNQQSRWSLSLFCVNVIWLNMHLSNSCTSKDYFNYSRQKQKSHNRSKWHFLSRSYRRGFFLGVIRCIALHFVTIMNKMQTMYTLLAQKAVHAHPSNLFRILKHQIFSDDVIDAKPYIWPQPFPFNG